MSVCNLQTARQMMAAVAMSITHLIYAGSLAFGGVLSDQLTSDDGSHDGVSLTLAQTDWVVSSLTIGALIGYVISGYLCPKLGALRLVQLAGPGIMAGYVMVGMSGGFWLMLAGRALTGVCCGITMGPTSAYIGEICFSRRRGMLSSMLVLSSTFGVCSTYLMGWQLGWRLCSLSIGLPFVLLQLFITGFLHSSAKWMIAHGHCEQRAAASLRYFQGEDCPVDAMISEVKVSLGLAHQYDAGVWQVLARFRHRANWYPLLLVICLISFMVFSGGLAATSFAPLIFQAGAAGNRDTRYIGAVLVGAVRFVAAVISTMVIERVRRSTLLAVTGAAGAVFCLLAGLSFWTTWQHSDICQLVAVLAIAFCMSMGISPALSVSFSELIPNPVRSVGCSLALFYFGLATFGLMQGFPLAVRALGEHVVFWGFGIVQLLMLLFSLTVMPDTRGKTLEQIQKLFETPQNPKTGV